MVSETKTPTTLLFKNPAADPKKFDPLPRAIFFPDFFEQEKKQSFRIPPSAKYVARSCVHYAMMTTTKKLYYSNTKIGPKYTKIHDK